MRKSSPYSRAYTAVKNGIGLVESARQNPDLASWYLSKNIKQPLAEVHGNYVVRNYPQQKEKIQQLQTEEQSWLLIVLDACRYDRFSAVFDEYFDGEVEPVVASGLDTFNYVREIWPKEYDYPYITAAAPINNTEFKFDSNDTAKAQGVAATGDRLKQKYDGYVPADHLNQIIEVWRTEWDEEIGVCPPEPVTEEALSIFRAKQPSRSVVHYFQPHAPYIGQVKELDKREALDSRLKGGALAADIWERAKTGNISRSELLDLYDANIVRALDSVARLVKKSNFDRTVIIGDHGEALGEYSRFGHGFEHPYVRLVPWAEIDGIKHKKAIPNKEDSMINEPSSKDSTVVDRLQELGYLD
ncbi:alkaline phosphatase family protein [Haloarcula amylovorans]|uniref:hypothetical protein n=1 Tax=Haloarcula amylovorans TaxID=2562280 RepID=UPI0010765EF6|nr:hypothetical protein [Halomicroarcula amylolytica]